MKNKVTFTTEVKEEICAHEFASWQLLSLIAGFVKVNGSLQLSQNGMSLSFQTENPKIAKFVFNSIKTLFNVNPKYSYRKKMTLDKNVVYGIHVEDEALEILEKLDLLKDGVPSFPREVVLEDKLRYFIAGVFLSSGSVNSPSSKNYHLQMVISDEDDAKYFLKLLNRFRNDRAMNFKITTKGNKFILYLKRAEQITTFLSIVTATNCMMDFELVRVEKDFINSDNRVQVCYNANYKKALAKGEIQAKEIMYIFDNGGESYLNEKEKIVAKIRLDNNEVPLSKIAHIAMEQYNVEISKSGVNHIFKRIHEKYLEMVEDGK